MGPSGSLSIEVPEADARGRERRAVGLEIVCIAPGYLLDGWIRDSRGRLIALRGPRVRFGSVRASLSQLPGTGNPYLRHRRPVRKGDPRPPSPGGGPSG